MRSIEEIKRGLQICGDPEWEYCRGCPFEGDEDCTEKDRDALAYIQQLERERDAAVEALYKTDEILIDHNWTGTHGCMNEVRKAINDGLIGVICARGGTPR